MRKCKLARKHAFKCKFMKDTERGRKGVSDLKGKKKLFDLERRL